MRMSATAHPWLYQPLKGRAHGERQRLRTLVADGWTLARRSNVEHPKHRQFRLCVPAQPLPVFVDLYAGTCSACSTKTSRVHDMGDDTGAAGGTGAAPGGCVHRWFAREMETRDFALPVAEWADPAPAPTWREHMAAYHRDLHDARGKREQEERERLADERRLRERLARERAAHFHAHAPPGGPEREDDDDGDAPRPKRARRTAPPASARSEPPPPRPPPPPPPPPSTPAREHVLNAMLRRTAETWQRLEKRRHVTRADIPWIPVTVMTELAAFRHAVDHDLLKSMRVLWHPDRFSQRFRDKVPLPDFAALLATITQTSQRINSLLTEK